MLVEILNRLCEIANLRKEEFDFKILINYGTGIFETQSINNRPIVTIIILLIRKEFSMFNSYILFVQVILYLLLEKRK